MRAQTVTIIGMDRVGASIGLALKQTSLQVKITGHDRDLDITRLAQEKLGAVDKAEWNLVNAASAADILILNVPAADLEGTLRAIGEDVQPHALVLDLSSPKGAGLKWAGQYLQRGHYVGVAPVLAAEWLSDGRTEIEAATAGLFKNSVFCLMPSAKAEPQAVETAVNFGLLLGATPYFVDALEYDSLAQGLITVPGLLAAALFNAVHEAPGWRDMLRFAGLSFAQTTQPLYAGEDIAYLALHDKAATLRWLDTLLEELRQIRRLVHEGDTELLTERLKGLAQERGRWLQNRARNEWTEAQAPPIEAPTMSQQMFGRWGRRRDKEE